MASDEKNNSRQIDAILRIARNEAAPAAKDEYLTFLKHYFANIAPDDLAEKEARAAYEGACKHRELAAHRPLRQALVKIHNPQVRIAPYTVVEVVTDDMPFLVDSVRMELNRQGFIVHLMIHPVYAVARNEQGLLKSIAPPPAAEYSLESFIHVEIDRIIDPARVV